MLPTTRFSLWSVCHHCLSYSTDQELFSLFTCRSHGPGVHLPEKMCDTDNPFMRSLLQNCSVGIMKWLLILSLFSVKNTWHGSNQKNCFWAVNPYWLCELNTTTTKTTEPLPNPPWCSCIPSYLQAYYTIPQNPYSFPMSSEHIDPPEHLSCILLGFKLRNRQYRLQLLCRAGTLPSHRVNQGHFLP